MIRHMFVTLLIVIAIYTGLLFIIGHPMVAVANEDLNDRASNVAHQPDVAANTEPNKETAFFNGPQVVGVEHVVDLSDGGDSVGQVWQLLFDNTALLNNVDWTKETIQAYAFYRNFDADMSRATLVVGFDKRDLLLQSSMKETKLPEGHYDQFSLDRHSGVAPDRAWLKANQYGNLIERHQLNRDGETVTADAIVVWK